MLIIGPCHGPQFDLITNTFFCTNIDKQQEKCPTQQELFALVVNPIVSTQVTSGGLICTSVDLSSVARVSVSNSPIKYRRYQNITYARSKQLFASTYSYVNKGAASTV